MTKNEALRMALLKEARATLTKPPSKPKMNAPVTGWNRSYDRVVAGMSRLNSGLPRPSLCTSAKNTHFEGLPISVSAGEIKGDDPRVATQRAILRAAASIEKAKEKNT